MFLYLLHQQHPIAQQLLLVHLTLLQLETFSGLLCF